MSRIDVLNLEWTSTPSRDRVMATLVCNYLRIQGLRVEERCVFDGYHELHQLKPRLFFMACTHGAPENLDLMGYAKSRGYLGISLISEGNFQGNSTNHQEMIWGWNKNRKLVEDVRIQWTKRTQAITLQAHPELAGRIRVSGGVGFDNYKISRTIPNKEAFVTLWGKQHFSKIIGVGCWDFGAFYPEDHRFVLFEKLYSDLQIQRFRKDGVSFDKILTEVALANTDILFLVKQHPGTILGDKAAGTTELSKLPNVLVLKNEISIYDCIALSDFWLVYESTTAMEAWLLGKQTCLLNPSGRDFPRDIVNEGSPLFTNAEQLMSAIHDFYENGELPGFVEFENNRHQVIQETIQWDDGLNHVRAGNEILDLLELSGARPILEETIRQRRKRWLQHVKWLLSPYVYRVRHCYNESANRKNFVYADLKKFQEDKYQDQLAFYQSKGLSLDQLRQVRGT